VTQITKRFISRLGVKLEDPDYGQCQTTPGIKSYSDLRIVIVWSCISRPRLLPRCPNHPFTDVYLSDSRTKLSEEKVHTKPHPVL